MNIDMNAPILVTGAAGFIGYHLSKQLLGDGCRITGFDNMNAYYGTQIKEARLRELQGFPGFEFVKGDLADKQAVDALFEQRSPETVIHLAAQAGVRYSIENPEAYINSNIVGFFNILEACRKRLPRHLVYASSSSVYGGNHKVPYSTGDKTDSPVSLYAATKKSNELMAHCYSKLYGIPATGLRFFTVYGPYGRPDMAYYSFTEKMAGGKPVQLYNNGDMKRDFTYIDDIVKGITSVADKPPHENEHGARHAVYNIGNNSPVALTEFVDTLERLLIEYGLINKPAMREYLPMQPGDVYQTYADIGELSEEFGFRPNTPLEAGLRRFVEWYIAYIKK
jgi:UDP-glucuronate 4-epimerase